MTSRTPTRPSRKPAGAGKPASYDERRWRRDFVTAAFVGAIGLVGALLGSVAGLVGTGMQISGQSTALDRQLLEERHTYLTGERKTAYADLISISQRMVEAERFTLTVIAGKFIGGPRPSDRFVGRQLDKCQRLRTQLEHAYTAVELVAPVTVFESAVPLVAGHRDLVSQMISFEAKKGGLDGASVSRSEMYENVELIQTSSAQFVIDIRDSLGAN